MRKYLISFIFLGLLLTTSGILFGKGVPVGLQKQLLVDDYVIDQKENITRGPPRKDWYCHEAQCVH